MIMVATKFGEITPHGDLAGDKRPNHYGLAPRSDEGAVATAGTSAERQFAPGRLSWVEANMGAAGTVPWRPFS